MTSRAIAALLISLSACVAPNRPPPAGVRACRQANDCPYAHTCEYRKVDRRLVGRCRLEVGRCISDWDCGPQGRRCQRFGTAPGVCVITGT
jgi:hypothetical protein